jgi:ElaB/YqjD/DUF883 family membrane-anchored ribosome-binding protein
MFGNRTTIGGNGSTMSEATAYAVKQATETMEGLRTVIDQTSKSLRELSQGSGQWAQGAQVRAREMAKEMRDQGEWAANTVSRQVEEYPLTSLVVAFGVGYLCAMMLRR